MIDLALLTSEDGTKYVDIGLDGSGNIATTNDIEQEIVVCFRLFLGEYDFNINLGMEWIQAFNGTISQNEFIFDMEEQFQQLVDVEECVVNIDKQGRTANFNIQITKVTGEVINVNIQ